MQPRIRLARLASRSDLSLVDVLQYPLITEKVVGAIDKQNKISFIVHKKATKSDIKKALEELHQVRVLKITVSNDRKGRKRANVRLQKGFKAEELATKLGVI